MSGIQFSNIKSKLRTPQVGYILIILAACFTGVIHSLTKPLLSFTSPSGIVLSPLVFAAIIYLINGAFFTPIRKDGPSIRRIRRRDLFIIVAIGVAEVSGLVAYFFGLRQTTAINASILTNGEIVFAVLIALTIFRERLSKKEFFPFSSIVVGIIILPVCYELIQSRLLVSSLLYGNLLVLLSGVFCAVDITLCRYVTSIDPRRITQMVSFVGAGLTLLLIGIFQIPFDVDPRQLPSIVLLGFFGTGMATFLFLTALKIIGTTRTVLLYSTNFAFGVVLAMAFLHESITITNMTSILLASAGIWLLRNRITGIDKTTTKKRKTISFKALCESCTHQSCCTSFASPLLFSKDIERLRSIGKEGNTYTKDVSIEGKKARAIRKKPNTNLCIFWNEKDKTCSIYDNRPFDCMMYPFDIIRINEKYHWIVYSCNPQSGWQWAEEHLKMLESNPQFIEVAQNIDVYVNLDEINQLKILDTLPYTVIREVNFNKLVNHI